MGLKLKPAKPKLQRRGARLLVTQPDGERHVWMPHKKGERRVVEWSSPKHHYAVTYSKDGNYAWLKGRDEHVGGPSQYIIAGGFWGDDIVAVRQTDDQAWVFCDRSNDKMALSLSQTSGIPNFALVASAIAGELNAELAEFLGVNRMLCDIDTIRDIRENPRYAALRNFKFQFRRPEMPVGNGRRAENKVRHELTNYDAMLKAGGGLLWPEQYEQVRKGVDTIVAEVMKGST